MKKVKTRKLEEIKILEKKHELKKQEDQPRISL